MVGSDGSGNVETREVQIAVVAVTHLNELQNWKV